MMSLDLPAYPRRVLGTWPVVPIQGRKKRKAYQILGASASVLVQ